MVQCLVVHLHEAFRCCHDLDLYSWALDLEKLLLGSCELGSSVPVGLQSEFDGLQSESDSFVWFE